MSSELNFSAALGNSFILTSLLTMLRIYLIRHHKPAINRTGRFSHQQAMQFVKDYQIAVIEELSEKPAGVPYHLQKVYCSKLNRAILTAKVLFGPQVQLIQDPLFNEFEQRVLRLPRIKLPIGLWLTISRIFYFAGFRYQGIEPFTKARERARQCALRLESYARAEKETALVAHGMLNYFIRKALRNRGWKLVVKAGNEYLGVSVLEK